MMRILVVEDDPILSHHLKVQLSELGNQVQVALTAKKGSIKLPITLLISQLSIWVYRTKMALVWSKISETKASKRRFSFSLRVLTGKTKLKASMPAPMTT